MSLEFLISRHGHLAGVRLSLRADFGNIPFASDEAAELEARRIADGRPFTIERKSFRALPSFGVASHD